MSELTIFAGALFIITYVLMFALQKWRPYIAVISAIIFVAVGSMGLFPGYKYTFGEALSQIDWNVLMMIAGTMGTVFLFIESGMPKLMSDVLVAKLHSVKWLIVVLSLFAGIISAFVDNVATVLMVAPVAIALCKELKISPVPAIICISISSNLQGAATLVGDTTSILLAKAAELDFMDFFFVEGKAGMFWVTEIGALASALIILFKLRKENDSVYVMERGKVEDKVPTALLLLTVLTLIATSFIPYKDHAATGGFYKPDISNGLICIFYFLIGIIHTLRKNKNASTILRAIKELDYYTLALLAGLFVVIGGITKAATMLPVVAVVTERLMNAGGLEIHPNLLYFGLLVGATLGGNITPIGASANIAGLGILRKEGHEVGTKEFMSYSVPFTLAAVITGYLLVWFIWM